MSEQQNNHSKFVYYSGEFRACLSQCKSCENIATATTCAEYGNIPSHFLSNKEKCEKYLAGKRI